MRYDDILHLPHHVSSTRPPMPLADRAAQFSPFAALTGYDAVLAEAARLTDAWVEPGEEDVERLNDCLRILCEHLREKPEVRVTFFQPDSRKEGGAYLTRSGRLKRVDEARRCLVLDSGETIPLSFLTDLSGPLLERYPPRF